MVTETGAELVSNLIKKNVQLRKDFEYLKETIIEKDRTLESYKREMSRIMRQRGANEPERIRQSFQAGISGGWLPK
jgi:hypothetical protein